MIFEKDQSPFIIAEVAQSHDGNVNFAHAFIDAVAKTGAHAIKFQTHIAEEESTPDEPWRVKFSHQDDTRYEYWKRMEFTKDQWQGLKAHAEEQGLVFLSSPFSIAATELLDGIGIQAWKIGSGEVLSKRMLDKMAKTGKPIILSSGMSSMDEMDRIIKDLQSKDINLAVMQCTTSYPVSLEQVGLNVLNQFKDRYDCPVGLSDHSGTIWPSIAAVTLGAELIEVHVAFSRDMFGPDVSSSLTIGELAQLVEGINAINIMRRNPVDKDNLDDHLLSMRALFMKSIVARQDLKAGDILSYENCMEKKPGTGILGEELEKYVGKTLAKPLKKDEQLTQNHIKVA